MRGRVLFFNDVALFGMIDGDDGEKYYFQYAWVVESPFRTLFRGMRAEFDAEASARGWQARNIRIRETRRTRRVKPNPFDPRNPQIDPEKFAGRGPELLNAFDALRNSQNILITGARGIGKSSLAYQLSLAAEGESDLLDAMQVDLDGYDFEFLVARHTCNADDGLSDIVNALTAELESALGVIQEDDHSSELALGGGPLKLTLKRAASKRRLSDLAGIFRKNLVALFQHPSGDFNGVCLVVDEIDRLKPAVRLTSFLRQVSEELSYEGLSNVVFVLAGISGVESGLLEEHGSIDRWYEPIEVPILSDGELELIVHRALRGFEVGISTSALNRMVSLAQGFPEPLHLLGYHAFRYDEDDYIDLADLEKAAQHVVKHVKRARFRERFEARPRHELADDVLRIMAWEETGSVTLDVLGEILSASEDQVAGVMGGLVAAQVVTRVSRRTFRLSEPLFQVYLRFEYREADSDDVVGPGD